ncbi:single-stranded DNA-binding protein [Halobacteriovorax sp. JY17]|uniref:single-stranded DNA-binding protein n=1 Tax=Halobacteriovorax sp. JY17 TaxID=2014617 RepID=UPI000C67822C|nr:single-stranded DNA-binding protein [Halobacteriovorax sp. JY17]PIK13526.1 MAG: single-stranded DNA-binding protein [Halobacteriovorax sp. JY17]
MNTNIMQLFVGRLGKEPDLRYTKNKKAVCHLSIATTNDEKKIIWNKVVVWGKQAELCSLYLKKGKEVFVQGYKEIREFTTNDGEVKEYEEITASLIGFPNL